MIRLTRLASRYATACAIARYVLPVPAGPTPNTMSICSIASRYRRCIDGLGTDLLAADRPGAALEEELLQLDVRILRNQLRSRLHVAAGEPVLLPQQAGQLLEHALGPGDVVGRAFDDDVVADGLDADVQGRFEVAEVLVEGSVEALNALVGHRNPAR